MESHVHLIQHEPGIMQPVYGSQLLVEDADEHECGRDSPAATSQHHCASSPSRGVTGDCVIGTPSARLQEGSAQTAHAEFDNQSARSGTNGDDCWKGQRAQCKTHLVKKEKSSPACTPSKVTQHRPAEMHQSLAQLSCWSRRQHCSIARFIYLVMPPIRCPDRMYHEGWSFRVHPP